MAYSPGKYDPRSDGAVRDAKQSRAATPKDAATLILVRRVKGVPQVLMGQRSAKSSFMPNKFVFPGGRMDPGDQRIMTASNLHPTTTEKVMADPRGARAVSEARARGLALAALRETFEETGLVLGKKSSEVPRTKSPAWRDYFATGVVPELEGLVMAARAITPPYRPKRFDARFFIGDADLIAADKHDAFNGSGELLQLHWVPVEDAVKLDIPNITRAIIEIVGERSSDGKPFNPSKPAPFFHFVRGKPQVVHV